MISRSKSKLLSSAYPGISCFFTSATAPASSLISEDQKDSVSPKVLTSSHHLPSAFVHELEPCLVKEALLDSKWLQAKQEEFTAPQSNNGACASL